MSYQDFTLAQTRGDWYVSNHGLVPPEGLPAQLFRPIDLKIIPPHYVGHDLGGKPFYQGFYALEAHFSWKSWNQLEAMFAYYLVGDDSNAQVTVGFYNPYEGGAYVNKIGWIHEPQVPKASVRLYLDVVVRFSHLVPV